MSRFPLRLTPELVARAHRVVPNVPLPHIAPRTEEDHKADVEEILSTRPPGDDLWLFAYGSLLWKPAFDLPRRSRRSRRVGTVPSACEFERFAGHPSNRAS